MASRKAKRYETVDNVEDIIEAIEDFEPETEVGRILKALVLRGLEEGVNRMTADEVMEYLGRPAYV